MAELLQHPDKNRDFSKSVYHLPTGSIAITTHTGEPLTHALALLMLHQAGQILVDESLDV